MAAAHGFLYLWIVFNLSLFLASAQVDDQFIYHGFNISKLQLGGLAKILPNGLLQLTNTSELKSGYAFYPSPFKFNSSSSQTLSFSTTFVFSMVSKADFGGNGLAFFISPSMNFTGAVAGQYLGLFSLRNNGLPTNHILAVELDSVQSPEFNDIDGNHVGIDVNSLISNQSATATYFSDKEERNETLKLKSGKPIQIWIDYNGTEKLLNVSIAPLKVSKPKRPLLSTLIDLSEVLLESMYVGFSAATGTRISDHYILGWSFNKSGPAQTLDISKLPPSPLPPPVKTVEGLDRTATVLLLALAVVLITVGGAVYFVREKKYEEVYEDWEKEYGPHRISYKKLYKATKGFKEKEVIGQGGFGKVYKGVLPSNVEIAVKRINHNSNEGRKQFLAEIMSMRRLRHRNLVQLRGYCRRKGELLLAYEYMPNGSLDKILYGDMKPNLNWFQRFRILKGVASGLLYLHEEWEQVVLHRDIKAANILLDADLNGKLGDFGLARLYDHGSDPQTTSLVGTVGYLAPEFLKTGKATTSTDVFAFGAFMLEVACGRRPMEPGMVDLADWVIDCWKKGAILDVCDTRLEGIFVEEQMELVLKLGLFCSYFNPETRPSMKQVTQYLDGQVRLPSITPDSIVIGTTAVRTVALDIVSLYSLPGSSSSHCLSTVDSILVVGRGINTFMQ